VYVSSSNDPPSFISRVSLLMVLPSFSSTYWINVYILFILFFWIFKKSFVFQTSLHIDYIIHFGFALNSKSRTETICDSQHHPLSATLVLQAHLTQLMIHYSRKLLSGMSTCQWEPEYQILFHHGLPHSIYSSRSPQWTYTTTPSWTVSLHSAVNSLLFRKGAGTPCW
jgi:hypothetical protein